MIYAALIVVYLIGYFIAVWFDNDRKDAEFMAVFWPLFLCIAAVVAPFFAIGALARWTANHKKSSQKWESRS